MIQGVFALLKSFLSSKVAGRLHMHGGGYQEALTPVLGERGWKALPPAFGGLGAELQMDAGVAEKIRMRLDVPWDP